MSDSRTDGEMIHLSPLQPLTRTALHNYSDKWGYDEWLGDRTWIAAEKFAWLIALLKLEEDKEELFPHGKWATIQHMEKLLEECLKEYRSVRR